jgi:tetratricopeptide (TPR) repeat protein
MNGPLFIVGVMFALLGFVLALPGLRAMFSRAPRTASQKRMTMAHWSAVGGAAVFLTGMMYMIDANTTAFEQRQAVLVLRLLFMGTALVAGNMYFREYARIKTLQKEISEAETAQFNGPVTAGHLVNLAGRHREIGQYERARQVLAQALEMEPHSPDAHYHLGQVYAASGDDAQAAAAYRRALREAQSDDSIRAEIETALKQAEQRLNRQSQ